MYVHTGVAFYLVVEGGKNTVSAHVCCPIIAGFSLGQCWHFDSTRVTNRGSDGMLLCMPLGDFKR